MKGYVANGDSYSYVGLGKRLLEARKLHRRIQDLRRSVGTLLPLIPYSDASKGFTPLRSGIFKAYWRRVITTRYSRARFRGAEDTMICTRQLTGPDKTLESHA